MEIKKMVNKKAVGGLSMKKLVALLLVALVVVLVIVGVANADIFSFFKGLPDKFGIGGSGDGLYDDAVIYGKNVKILINDGQGRCVVVETEPGPAEALKHYGVRSGRLEMINPLDGQWSDSDGDEILASDDQIWKRNLKDNLTAKKDYIKIKYNGTEYSGKFGFWNFRWNGILVTINNYIYLFRGDNRPLYRKDILGQNRGYDFNESKEIKDAIFSSFIYLPENGFDFQGKYLRLRYDGGWYDDKDNYLSGAYYDEKDKAVYGILHVVPSDYYGIDYDGVFYYKKPSGDWQRFEKDKKENKYLYEDSVWQSSLFQRRIKQDLMRECYTD